MNNTRFAEAFDLARSRIGQIHGKVILEEDPVKQALLEMYATYVSGARFNDCENH
jgi:hypothetical protein